MLARRLLLDFPWADCLRPLEASLDVGGDIRLWAKRKVDELSEFPSEAPTRWAAMQIATSHLRLLNHKEPITAAEALKLRLVPKSLPEFPVSEAEIATVWGYGKVPGLVIKGLRKGLPWAKGTARDSVTRLAQELAVKHPALVKMMVFGDYPHATTLASMELRLELASVRALQDFVGKLPSQTLLALFSEFIVAATCHHTAVYCLVRGESWWRGFQQSAIRVADQVLRPRLFRREFASLGNMLSVPRVGHVVHEYQSIWPLFIKALEVNTRLKDDTVALAGPLFARAQELGGVTVLGGGLIRADLDELQIPCDVIEAMIEYGSGPANRAMKQMRGELAKLTPSQRATLKVYIHARESYSFETVTLLASRSNAPKRFAYCTGCQSCRSKFVCRKGVSKRLHGLEVSLKHGAAFCSSCKDKRVQLISIDRILFQTRYVNRVIYSLFCPARTAPC